MKFVEVDTTKLVCFKSESNWTKLDDFIHYYYYCGILSTVVIYCTRLKILSTFCRILSPSPKVYVHFHLKFCAKSVVDGSKTEMGPFWAQNAYLFHIIRYAHVKWQEWVLVFVKTLNSTSLSIMNSFKGSKIFNLILISLCTVL